MKKSSKIYLLLWLGVIVSFVLLIVASRIGLFSPHHQLAQDPGNIEKITELDLPDVTSVESWNNLERCSSRWDCFEHRSYFAGKLSDECVHQLEIKCQTDSIHWHKDSAVGYYEYHDDAWNRGDIYCINCRIYEKGYSYVEYYVDELEGTCILIWSFMAFISVVLVLVSWGIVLLATIIVHKHRRYVNLC